MFDLPYRAKLCPSFGNPPGAPAARCLLGLSHAQESHRRDPALERHQPSHPGTRGRTTSGVRLSPNHSGLADFIHLSPIPRGTAPPRLVVLPAYGELMDKFPE